MPTTVRAAAKIPLPIETCWKNFRDLTRAKDYVPGLSDTVITINTTQIQHPFQEVLELERRFSGKREAA